MNHERLNEIEAAVNEALAFGVLVVEHREHTSRLFDQCTREMRDQIARLRAIQAMVQRDEGEGWKATHHD